MASIKPVKATYSRKLDPMTRVIGNYLRSAPDALNIKRTWKAVQDFCHNNSPQFTEDFLRKIGETPVQFAEEIRPDVSVLFDDFVTYMASLPGECVFLLKDTHAVMHAYQEKSGRGYGILVNRNFLCDNDEDRYFTLIEMLYSALDETHDWNQFIATYLEGFQLLIRHDKRFAVKSKQIFEYLATQKLSEPVIWVDLGFQFTFVLFCYASVHIHSRGKVHQRLFCLTVYPWLQTRFRGNYFTESNEAVLEMELNGIHSFYEDRTDRFAGALLGFAIGDALGFPAAGIDKRDVSRFVTVPIREFEKNPRHPYFSSLMPGQFTDNTNLLLLSAEHITGFRGFQRDDYISGLVQWSDPLLDDMKKQRWLGPTATLALKRLRAGADYRDAGSTMTQSCSATYRIIPFALVYSPFGAASPQQLREVVETVAMITHNSQISKAGALIIALLFSGLLSGLSPGRALSYALTALEWDAESELLKDRLLEANAMYHDGSSDAHVRKVLGTGSPVYQTVPLACYYFLKYHDDFDTAVTAAANSFRDDTPEERRRLASLSWEEQLIACVGGNTDGIAAITGALVGVYLGQRQIPGEFLKVECGARLRKIAAQLASVQPSSALTFSDANASDAMA